ncbi:hypothetical protein N8642_00150 [bacterium]|jgi:hypothetical protein|nr:hypothetical protein [bacterium]
MTLGELAEVRQGLTLRGGLLARSPAFKGPHLLKIGDLTDFGEIRIDVVQPIEVANAFARRFSVQTGDVVIANRGNRMTAAMIPEGLDAIASGQLVILRITSQLVEKEYVHWYLNLERTQKLLFSLTRGSLVRTLSVKVLKQEIDVPIPSREVQMGVVRLAKLAARESELVRGIDSFRKKFLEAVLVKHIVERS